MSEELAAITGNLIIHWSPAMTWSPPNLDRAVKNIASESAKSNYNPKIDMNWCNLPMEMRLECVKRMDFKERCHFRRTSQAEKSLVEAKKYQFEHFKISHDQYFGWTVIAKKRPESCQLEVHSGNRYAPDYGCITAILKHAEVKNFGLITEDQVDVSPLLEHMAKFAPFGFKRVSVFYNSFLPFFIKNCPNLEKVDYCRRGCRFSLSEILEAPSLMNIKEFKFAKVHSEDFLKFFEKLVQKWIDNDAGIGKSIQFSMECWEPTDELSISAFAEKFSDRVIEKTEKEVRIRMNNSTKQILLRQVGAKLDEFRDLDLVTFEYCSCKVIPIDTPKSE